MNQATISDRTWIADPQLLAELQRSMELRDHGIRLHREYERHAGGGPEPEYERYLELHAAYMQAHKQHMVVHVEVVSFQEELEQSADALSSTLAPS